MGQSVDSEPRAAPQSHSIPSGELSESSRVLSPEDDISTERSSVLPVEEHLGFTITDRQAQIVGSG